MSTIKILKAKDYNNRSELENAIRNTYGLTITKKDVQLKGTRAELKKLRLSNKNLFWGIVCVESNPVKKNFPKKRPQRGKKHKSGINLNKSTIKKVE